MFGIPGNSLCPTIGNIGFSLVKFLTRVPGKPISANRGLNLATRETNFIPRLDSVPESTINLNLGINYLLNLTRLARSINSLII